jgi:hypothetical protein
LWWLEVGVANDYFPGHAPRLLIEDLIRTAGRLAPSRWLCRGVPGVMYLVLKALQASVTDLQAQRP